MTSKLKEPIPYQDFLQIQPGDIVFYLLLPEAFPVDPTREWKGRVTFISHPSECARVQTLEEGYNEEEETVKLVQIVRYEKTKE